MAEHGAGLRADLSAELFVVRGEFYADGIDDAFGVLADHFDRLRREGLGENFDPEQDSAVRLMRVQRYNDSPEDRGRV